MTIALLKREELSNQNNFRKLTNNFKKSDSKLFRTFFVINFEIH
jgi:hypothetical protein